MPIKSIFMNGGFVLHKAYISGSECKFSAWYDKAGNLLDAERYDSMHRAYKATAPQLAELERLGSIWKGKTQ